MARDLLIHGIHGAAFKQKISYLFAENQFPENELEHFLYLFNGNISIRHKQELEEYLYQKLRLTIEEQHELIGIEELISFRSKQICFAIAQLIHYYSGNFSWEPTKDPALTLSEGCFITYKIRLLDILDWLIAISSRLIEDDNNWEKHVETVYQIQAKVFIETGNAKGDEFTYFADQLGYFQHWKKLIENSDFDYYYWEDSY